MKVFKWILLPLFLIIWYFTPVFSISIFIWLIEFIADWWTIVILLMFTFISGIILWISIILPSFLGNLLIYFYDSKWVKYLFSIFGAISIFSIFSTIKYNPQIRPFLSYLKDILDESLLKSGLLFLLAIEFAFVLLYAFVLAPLFISKDDN